MAKKPVGTLAERVESGLPFNEELEEPADLVSSHFPHPSVGDLHIFIKLPPGEFRRFCIPEYKQN